MIGMVKITFDEQGNPRMESIETFDSEAEFDARIEELSTTSTEMSPRHEAIIDLMTDLDRGDDDAASIAHAQKMAEACIALGEDGYLTPVDAHLLGKYISNTRMATLHIVDVQQQFYEACYYTEINFMRFNRAVINNEPISHDLVEEMRQQAVAFAELTLAIQTIDQDWTHPREVWLSTIAGIGQKIDDVAESRGEWRRGGAAAGAAGEETRPDSSQNSAGATE